MAAPQPARGGQRRAGELERGVAFPDAQRAEPLGTERHKIRQERGDAGRFRRVMTVAEGANLIPNNC